VHLTRQLIIDAALKLAADSGVENLSIRKVALRLGVTPMALYKHFNSKEELLSFALEAFIARANVIPDEEMPWEDWVYHVARKMYLALCSDYSWVRILGSVRVGAEAAEVTDAFVSKLTSAGFTARQAVQAYFAVIQSVFGAVCLRASMSTESGLGQESDLSSATRMYLEQPSLERLEVAPEIDRIAKMEQIDIGLPMIISAMQEELR
jgi:TetR/AcrR family tetracycline transcriptional repressor